MKEILCNPFEKFNSDWALLAAGPAEKCNAMTISWGSMGTIWGKPVITVYVRPDRYTWGFLKENDTFTVSFYPERYRDALMYMGRESGRDGDKAAAAHLTVKPLAAASPSERRRRPLCAESSMCTSWTATPARKPRSRSIAAAWSPTGSSWARSRTCFERYDGETDRSRRGAICLHIGFRCANRPESDWDGNTAQIDFAVKT